MVTDLETCITTFQTSLVSNLKWKLVFFMDDDGNRLRQGKGWIWSAEKFVKSTIQITKNQTTFDSIGQK